MKRKCRSRNMRRVVRRPLRLRVKPDNVGGLMAQAEIDGGLVGGASLKADSFCALIEVAGRIKDR